MFHNIYHPFGLLIAGPSQSGKTELVKKLILNRNEFIVEPPEKIIFHYSEFQSSYDDLIREGVEFIQGPPSELPDGSKRVLLIIDDLLHETGNSRSMAELFTRGIHHRNTSVIYIIQNLFDRGSSQLRTISLQASALIIMRSPRDSSQILPLARQVCPQDPNFIVDAYRQATIEPHSYLYLDFQQKTHTQIRVRSNIFKENNKPVKVYLSKKLSGLTS